MKLTDKLWIGITVLIVLSPLGLLLPQHFKAGGAWGESPKLSGLWHAPIPDYTFKGWEEKGLPLLSFAYIISAAIGVLIVVLLVLIIGKILTKKGD
jgi:hypothetical protein